MCVVETTEDKTYVSQYEAVYKDNGESPMNVVDISEHQFVFMKGISTTDAAIFALKKLQEKYREGQ